MPDLYDHCHCCGQDLAHGFEEGLWCCWPCWYARGIKVDGWKRELLKPCKDEPTRCSFELTMLELMSAKLE